MAAGENQCGELKQEIMKLLRDDIKRGDTVDTGRGGEGKDEGLKVRMGSRSRQNFHGNSRKSGGPGGHRKRPLGKKTKQNTK